MNTWFPRLARRSELPESRFNFEYDTSKIELDGNFFRVLVVVYDDEDFELWNPALGAPVDLSALPLKDQAIILKTIEEKTERRESAEELFGDTADRIADIREMNGRRAL